MIKTIPGKFRKISKIDINNKGNNKEVRKKERKTVWNMVCFENLEKDVKAGKLLL